MNTLIAVTVLCSHFSFAGSLKAHKVEIQKYSGEVSRYEYRMLELKEAKRTVRGSSHLDEILGEIAEIHRDILGVRKKRRDLKLHLGKEHPGSDLLYDVSLHKKYEKKRKADGHPVNKDLDRLLLLVQSQYAKYITSSRPKVKPDKVKKELEGSKARAKKKSRKEYIRKKLNNEMNVH